MSHVGNDEPEYATYLGALGNKGKHAATRSQGKVVTCYNCRGQGHVAKECKEKKRAKDSQWFKDKALLMEAKEKGAILDAEAEAFLADVECTTPYAEPLAITTTTAFEVSHEDAYDSDVDEAPHAAATFMANLMQTGPSTGQGTSNDTDFHSEIHGGEQLDSDVDSVIDDHDNTIPYHQYQLNNEVESVPTDVSSVIPGEISVITILDDLRSQLEGHIKTNEEQSFANDSLKAELERYKTQVQNLEQKSEKLKADKNALEESYLEELVWLRNTNKVVTELLQSYGQPVQTVPMLSRGVRGAVRFAQLCRPTLYLGDVIVDPVHTPFRVYDSKETLVQAEVSRTKMLERMKDPLCKVSSKPINYAKLNSLYDTFVPQKQLSSEQVYWLPANEVASYNCNQSKPITTFGIEDNLFKEVSEYMKIFDELDKEYDQCVIDKKSLEIENKNLLIQNECLLAESVSKDICSVVLTSDIAVPMSVEPRSNCVKEHSRNLELEAEILKMKQLLVEKEKRCSFIETKYQELELKFQKYKECFENPQVCNNSSSPELNVFFEINKLKDQLQIRLVTRGIRRLKTGTMKRS
ncbi:retrovirus-related pol polyprotein from transposon TNT 1-94 [Tanacetum coccineum]